MKENFIHPQAGNDISLVRWLVHPLAWSVSQKAGVLVLLFLGACLLVFLLEPEISNLLAIAAYLVLAVSILLVTWWRFFKP